MDQNRPARRLDVLHRALDALDLDIGRWGRSAPFPPEGNEVGIDSTILALKTMLDPESAGARELEVELRLHEQTFDVRVAGGEIAIARGEAEDPDATLAASPGTLAALLWQGLDLDEAERSGSVELEGDRRKLERFLGMFPVRG